MIIKQDEISILKSIVAVNKTILLRPGNKVWAKNQASNLFICVELSDSFDKELAIYDFSVFVRMLASFKSDVTLDSSEPGYLNMSNSDRSIRYRLTEKNMIKNTTDQPADLTNADYYFKMSANQMSDMQTLVGDIEADRITFQEGGIHLINSKDSGSSSAIIKNPLKGYPGKTTIKYDQSPINLIAGDYDVALKANGSHGALKFTHLSQPLYMMVGIFQEDV